MPEEYAYEREIRPEGSNLFKSFRDLWRHRDLLWILAKRDLKVQYSDTFLGLLWAVLKPLFFLLILSFVFGRLAKVGTGEVAVPHIVYTATGLVVWNFIADVMTGGVLALTSFRDIIQKVFFPRIIIPMYRLVVATVDVSILVIMILLLVLYHGVSLSSNIFFLPVLFGLLAILGFASSLWVASLSIRFTDIKHIIPVIIRIGMYASPVAYSSQLVPLKYKWLYYCNPVAGMIDLFRWSVLGEPLTQYVYISGLVLIILLITGLILFQKVERQIADLL